LLFFSASSSKLPSYILPMFPALALVLGAYLAQLDVRRFRPHLIVPALVWLAVIGLAATRIDPLTADLPLEDARLFARALQAAGMSFLALTLVVAWLARRQRPAAGAVMLTGLVSLFAATLVMLGHDHYARLKHAREIVAAARPVLGDAPVFAVQTYDQTLPFYLQRNVVLVDYVDEFAYGQRAEPQAWIPALYTFEARWRALPQAGALMSPDTFKRLSDQGLPMRVIYRDSRRLFVVKP
jgi:4-amino-4-deoxy-L-arabinose transferase-like glycosyltransferase